MENARKFTFGESFVNASGQIIHPEVEKAYKQGCDEGYSRGSQIVNDEVALLIKAIDANLAEILKNQKEAYAFVTESTMQVVRAILNKIVPHALSKYGDHEVVCFVDEVLKNLENQVSIEIRVHPDLLTAVEEKIQSSCELDGALKINLKKDDAIDRKDCFVNWNDGGISLMKSKLLEQIHSAIDRVLVNVPHEPIKKTIEPEGENHGG